MLLYYYNESYFLDTNWDITPVDCPCRYTNDKNTLRSAAGVVFHIPGLLVEELKQLPAWHAQRPDGQPWVAYSQESAVNYPLLNDDDLMRLFDYEVSYRQQADIWQPYLDQEVLKGIGSCEVRAKTGFCAAFISSALNRSFRQELLRELMEYIPVDSFGRFARNKKLPEDRGRPYSAEAYAVKLNTIADYRFTLAFENSLSVDYVTEKFFHPLMAGSVPVYYGASNIEEFSPGDNAFINAREFSSSRKLAEYLQSVDDSQFHEWRNKPLRPAFLEKVKRSCTRPFAALCEMLLPDH